MNTQNLLIVDQLNQALFPETGDAGDLRVNFRRIAQAMQAVFGSDICALLAINPVTEEFILPLEVAGALPDADRTLHNLPRKQGSTQYVLDQEIVFIEDIVDYPHLQNHFTTSQGIRAFAAIALYTRPQRKPLAVLYLDYHAPHQFSSDDRTLLRVLANQVTVALQHTWLLHRYAEVTHIGQQINQEIATIDSLFRNLHRLIGNILDIDHFFMIAVYQSQTNSLDYYLAEDTIEGQRFAHLPQRPFAGACGWVIQEQQSLLISHRSRQTDLPIELVPISDSVAVEESLIFVPLSLRDVPLGVITIQSVRPNAYDQEDLRVLQLLGNHVALALSNIRLFAGLLRINQAGQALTQQLDLSQPHDSWHVLQRVVEQIQVATQADLVTLYPYDATKGRLDQVLYSGAEPPLAAWTDQFVEFFSDQTLPLFAREQAELSGLAQEVGAALPIAAGMASTAAIPLLIGTGPIGFLMVGFRQAQRFDAPQKLLIESLASYAATVVAATKSAIARYVKELEILKQIDQELAKALTLPQTLRSILKLATDHIRTSRAGIFLYDPVAEVLEANAFYPMDPSAHQQKVLVPIADRRGLVWWAFEHQRPVHVNNVKTDPEWRDLYISLNAATVSELDVPMMDGDTIVGIINFESVDEAAFNQEDLKFLVVLAGQAVLAVRNAQAYQHEAEERQALIAINTEIVGQLDRQRVFDLIIEKALALTNSPAGTLMLYHQRQDHLWMAAERGVSAEQKGKSHRLDEGVVGMAAREQRAIIVGDMTKPPWSDIRLLYIPGARSELAVPLLEGDVLRGVINIESTVPYHFSERDERLVTALAGMAVIALQNAERYARAEKGRQRLLVLHEIDETIIRQVGDPELVMRFILENALQLTKAEVADLDLYENDRLGIVYSTRNNGQVQRWSADAPGDAAPPPKRGIMAYVAKTRAPYRTTDNAQHDPHFVGEVDIRSEVAVPLLSETNTLIGILNVESRQDNAFDEDDETMLSLFAGQAVIAIKNARNYVQVERERERFRLLYQAGAELGALSSLAQVVDAYAIILRIACMRSSSRGVIRRYDPTEEMLHPVHTEGYPDTPSIPAIKLGEGLNGNVALPQNRTIRVIHDRNSLPPGSVHNPTILGRSVVIIPILFRDSYYGNLTLTHELENHFIDADVELLDGLAIQLALTIYRLEAASAQQDMAQRVRESETMSSIGQATLTLAHRLGNDLGAVRATVSQINQELARLGVSSPPIADKLSAIVQDVRKALDLSSGLKAELDQPKSDQHSTQTIIVQELLEETARSYQPIPEGITVVLEDAKHADQIRAVHRQVADILHNLFVNAIQAMPNGGTITLRTRTVGVYVEIQMTDTGVGIADKQLTKIFELLFSTKGTFGFGLWSARRDALANGGELKVESQHGTGTTFTLSLPRAKMPQ